MFLKTKTKAEHYVAEIVGWYGVFAILFAYAALMLGWVTIDNLWYSILNTTGALGLLVISAVLKDYQSSTLNFLWLIIGLVGLINLF